MTRDLEIKMTSTGFAIGKGAIAVNRRRKTGEGYTDEVSFFDFIILGKSAESLAPYLIKGKQLAITGQLKQERWQGADGAKHSRVEIVVEHTQLLGGAGKDGGGDARQGPAARGGDADEGAGDYGF
jgi:single-strand DNA-binding protein